LEDLANEDDNINLFKIQSNTEKLFIARELEREFKDINKYEKDNLKVWEKQISTHVNRAGTIRTINGIPALRPQGERKRGKNPLASS
jgi:hypothetical protein